MIDLYAIIDQQQIMQKYIRTNLPKHKKLQLESLLKHFLKSIKKQNTNQPFSSSSSSLTSTPTPTTSIIKSKIIKSTKIEQYTIYYFQQASFIFILATIIQGKVVRMHNYLRVVADIFYQNYDEKKFHYVLQRIIQQVNNMENGVSSSSTGNAGNNNNNNKKQNIIIQDEQSSLMSSSMLQQKIKLSKIIDKKNRQNRQSSRAYIIMTILFLSIVVIAGLYLAKKWN